jgi:hypothetical protein
MAQVVAAQIIAAVTPILQKSQHVPGLAASTAKRSPKPPPEPPAPPSHRGRR